MRKLFTVLSSFAVIIAFTVSPAMASGGFNQYGYNYGARIFNGTGMDWCNSYAKTNSLKAPTVSTCEAWLGGPYTNDQLVMKWNAQWDTCNNGGSCIGAWLDNEWNGKVSGGSGAVWHYKIIWVGSVGSQYWIPGGESVWGSYEIIMDQGSDKTGVYTCGDGSTPITNNGGHAVCTVTSPNGYGAVVAQ